MDRVILPTMSSQVGQRVTQDKGEGIAWLRAPVNAHNVKPGAGVPHGATARAAEQVK